MSTAYGTMKCDRKTGYSAFYGDKPVNDFRDVLLEFESDATATTLEVSWYSTPCAHWDGYYADLRQICTYRKNKMQKAIKVYDRRFSGYSINSTSYTTTWGAGAYSPAQGDLIAL